MKLSDLRLSKLVLMFLFSAISRTALSQMPCTVQAVTTAMPGNPMSYSFYAYLAGDSICNSVNPQYIWTIYGNPNVTLSGPQASFTFNSPGIYLVCLKANYLGLTSTICDTLFVQNPGPDCTPSFLGNTQGLTAEFTLNNIIPPGCYDSTSVFLWSFGDSTSGVSVGNSSISHTYATAGTYHVCVVPASGSVSSCAEITVTNAQPQYVLGGMILAGGNCLQEPVMVEIYGIGNNFYQSMTINGGADSCFYFFQTPVSSQPAAYLIRATPLQANTWLPTYYGDDLFWADASLIIPDQSNFSLHINLVPNFAALGSGSGSVTGNIAGLGNTVSTQINGTDVNTQFSAASCRVVLMDANNQPLKFATVGSTGNFQFSNLPTGNYALRADHPAIPGVTFPFNLSGTGNQPNIPFTVTNSGISLVSATGIPLKNTSLLVWPNPVETNLHLEGNPRFIWIFDSKGRSALSLKGCKKMDTSILPPGIYHIRVLDDDGSVKSAEFVRN